MPKIVAIHPLAAFDSMNKLVLDDGSVVHVPKHGPVYEVGGEYVAPVEEPASEGSTFDTESGVE